MRIAAVLALVCAGALGGCLFLPGPDATPGFAPGIEDDRVQNASRLAAAHRTSIANTSYSHIENASQSVDATGYHYAIDHRTRVHVAANGSFLYHHRALVDESDGDTEYLDGLWANDTVALARTVRPVNGTVTYTRYHPPEPYTAVDATRSGISAALENATIAARWNESGQAFARLEATETETRRMAAANGSVVTVTTIRTATAVVREDGLVRELETTLEGTRPLPVAANRSVAGPGRPLAAIRESQHVRYEQVGTTTVPRPLWVVEALEATDGLASGERTTPRPVG